MNTRARLLPGWPVETWLFLSGSVLALAVAPIASELASRTFWIGIPRARRSRSRCRR